jgi:hypothetical protein
MSYTVHGTCSKCGGAVCTPTAWMSVAPAVPTCSSCGAVPKRAHGPVIEMEEPKDTRRLLTEMSETSI